MPLNEPHVPEASMLYKQSLSRCFHRAKEPWQQKQTKQCRMDIQELNNKQRMITWIKVILHHLLHDWS